MSQKLTYYGKVEENGVFTIHNRNAFIRDLVVFRGKRVQITVEKVRSKRSIFQNSFYWAVVCPCVQLGLYEAGWSEIKTPVNAHDRMKELFLKKSVVNEKTGEVHESIGSTKELTKSEFMDYIAEIQQWAAEYLGVVIPDPNEQAEILFKDDSEPIDG